MITYHQRLAKEVTVTFNIIVVWTYSIHSCNKTQAIYNVLLSAVCVHGHILNLRNDLNGQDSIHNLLSIFWKGGTWNLFIENVCVLWFVKHKTGIRYDVLGKDIPSLKYFMQGLKEKLPTNIVTLTEDFIQFLFISNISISFLIYMKSQLVVQVKETSNVFITCSSWTEISTPAICLFVVVQILFLYFYYVIASCKLYHGQQISLTTTFWWFLFVLFFITINVFDHNVDTWFIGVGSSFPYFRVILRISVCIFSMDEYLTFVKIRFWKLQCTTVMCLL